MSSLFVLIMWESCLFKNISYWTLVPFLQLYIDGTTWDIDTDMKTDDIINMPQTQPVNVVYEGQITSHESVRDCCQNNRIT